MLRSQRSETPLRSASLRTFAPAKINLTLEILGRRPDGYHELRSLVIGIGLSDELRATAEGELQVTIECDDPSLCGPSNLAARAAQLLLHRTGGRGVRFVLQKRVPLAAGLGGGSSDAAAALRLCNDLWQLNLTRDEFKKLGAQVGSDVALFFDLPSAVMTGRGETVKPLPIAWRGYVVLVIPPVGVSTAKVYAAHELGDAQGESTEAGRNAAAPANRLGDTSLAERIAECRSAEEISELTINQLEPALFRVAPALRELLEQLAHLKLGRPRVSGSGSSMYLLFDDPHSAARAASIIQSRIPHVKTMTAAAPAGEVPVDCIQ